MKKLFLIITLVFSLFVISAGNLKAADATKFDNKTEVIKSHTEIKQGSILGGASYFSSTFSTYNGCVIESKFLADHNTYWVTPDVPVADTDIKVVSYSQGTNYNWQGARPTSIAQQFERDNPGWIVLAGANNDFFHINDNCEPSGTFMQNGDLLKPWQYNDIHQPLGFKEDGTYIVGDYTVSSKAHLKRLNDSGKYEDLGEITTPIKSKPNLSESGINLLTRFLVTSEYKSVDLTNTQVPVDLSGHKVVVITYDLERWDRNTGNVFVKGVVTDIVTGQKEWKFIDAESRSYLVSKDGSLDNISVGDELKCECVLGGKWAEVASISGAYAEILANGKVVEYATNNKPQADYVNTAKNRTIMGFKADGTPIMMVVEKQGTSGYGASYQECGEILKGLGCVQGYLFDGGGSSTLFYRTNEGQFKILNKTEDGSERSDANAVLLVTKDPGFKFDISFAGKSATFKLNVKNQERFSQLSDLKITFNGETKSFTNNEAKFDNLKLETKYDYSISYTDTAYDTSKKVTKTYNNSYTTPEFQPQDIIFKAKVVDKNEVTFEKTSDECVKNVHIVIDGKSLSVDEGDTFVVTDFDEDKEYTVKFTYDYESPEIDHALHLESGEISFKTLDKALPKLTKFETKEVEDDAVSFNYQIVDEDSVIDSAYLLVNEEKVTVDPAKKTIKVKDLDLANNEYTFKLVIEYGSKKIETEQLTYGTKQAGPVDPPTPPEPAKSGCGNSGLVMVLSMITLASALAVTLRKKH